MTIEVFSTKNGWLIVVNKAGRTTVRFEDTPAVEPNRCWTFHSWNKAAAFIRDLLHEHDNQRDPHLPNPQVAARTMKETD
jgi:hypothetical protein